MARATNDNVGSIPVHTGKPIPADLLRRIVRVYPRTHGETYRKGKTGIPIEGLSPYTRGNPQSTCADLQHIGSIPVHTGKPIIDMLTLDALEVYPRTHGETNIPRLRLRTHNGLSPYTRGNRSGSVLPGSDLWSIPVHTGKPIPQLSILDLLRVYPRTHGETEADG